MMTHIGDMAKERSDAMRAMGVTRIVAPMHVHSFHETPSNSKNLPKKRATSLPQGYKVAFLALTSAEVDTVADALLVDDSLCLRVPLCDIYKMTADIQTDTVPKMHRDKIAAWVNVRFFAFNPPNASRPLLFTPLSLQVSPPDADDESWQDPSKTLVIVAPAHAKVRITDEDRQPAVVAQDDHQTHADLMEHDLRKDIIYVAHNNNHHPSRTRTLKTVREMAWWPSMESSVKYHVDACPICMASMATKKAVGCSIVSALRLHTVVIDHYVLKDSIPTLTGKKYILSACCLTTGFTLFVVVNSDSAFDTVRALYERWYPVFGVPTAFKSDRGPGFTSNCMAEFRRVMGVKKWEFSAADNATQHAVVEHKHEILHHVLSVAHLKGDIHGSADLKFYVASAMAQQNLYLGSHGFAPFEMLTGQPPRTVTDMPFIPSPHDALTPVNRNLINRIDVATKEAVAMHLETRADNVRRNILNADATLYASKKRYVDIRRGEEVSYNGHQYTVQDTISHGPSGLSKVVLIDSQGVTDTVNADAVTGLAEPTTELMIPQSRDLVIGDFVFVPIGDEVTGGVITAVDETTLQVTVHRYEPAPQQKLRYAATWVMPDTSRVRSRRQPPTSVPSTVMVASADIIVRGDITITGTISEGMLEHLQSTGVVCPAVVHEQPMGTSRVLSSQIPLQAWTPHWSGRANELARAWSTPQTTYPAHYFMYTFKFDSNACDELPLSGPQGAEQKHFIDALWWQLHPHCLRIQILQTYGDQIIGHLLCKVQDFNTASPNEAVYLTVSSPFQHQREHTLHINVECNGYSLAGGNNHVPGLTSSNPAELKLLNSTYHYNDDVIHENAILANWMGSDLLLDAVCNAGYIRFHVCIAPMVGKRTRRTHFLLHPSGHLYINHGYSNRTYAALQEQDAQRCSEGASSALPHDHNLYPYRLERL
jgi:hypothetical protein